jgi:polysaccharide export outer membrane protein
MVAESLRPGDHVFIVVHGQEALTGDFEVRPGGEVILPAVGPVPAAGGTPVQLAALLRDRMKGLLTDPQVSASLSLRKTVISVIGEVKTAGQYELTPGENVLQALARSGGLGIFANEDGIYVVRQKPNPQRVRFRYSDLVNGDVQSNRFELADGDIIVVE